MGTSRSWLLLSCLFLGLAGPALAQGRGDGGRDAFHVGLHAFGYFESAEDGLNGQTVGGGMVVGARLSPGFSLEGEVAVPAFFTSALRRHRDIAASLLAGWHPLPDGGADLVVVAGPGLLLGQTRSPSGDFATSNVALVLGGDVRWPLAERVLLVACVRAHLVPGVAILRPGVGVHWTF